MPHVIWTARGGIQTASGNNPLETRQGDEPYEIFDDEAAFKNRIAELRQPQSLEAAIAQVKREIDQYAKQLRDEATGNVSAAEAGAWTNKETEAIAYQNTGNENDAPMLAIEAEQRGVSVDNIAQRVLDNANAWRTLEGTISGVAGKHKDAVAQMTAIADVLAYDWRQGWPP